MNLIAAGYTERRAITVIGERFATELNLGLGQRPLSGFSRTQGWSGAEARPAQRAVRRRPPRRRGRSLPRTRQPPVKALLEEVLLHAAFEGNLRIFRKNVRALDEGDGRLADKVGAVRDSDGLGALHLAAAREKLPVCHYLVEELRVDVDAVDNKGETALTFAINCGNEDMVRYLLDHGADTEKINNDGLTALHFAAGEGAYIDSLTTGGTALHCAAYNGRDAVVKILLDHHADHKKVSWGAYTPLFVAVESGSLKCLKLLIERKRVAMLLM
uniref:Ankyrin-like protein n=1 Tax=Oryza sativa subsp. japonica TaxID=39947 RepID=Q6K5P6_ORYSJ|nr:ankyrin-like protein [Oryza sativa Japonica Group]